MNETVKKILSVIGVGIVVLLILALFVAGAAAIVGIFALFKWLLPLLPPIWAFIIMSLLLIGGNVVTFYESYVWKRRKEWYFPLTLCISILCIIVFWPMFFG